MSEKLPDGMTHTVGFYNGNRWPIQLVISRFNCTLHLQPGEYVLDKKGRKINDPFFEAYAKTNQLKREMADQPVALIVVPLAANAPTVPSAQCDGQAVRTVTQWKVDDKGLRQPVIPAPANLPPQPVNKPSVVPMTVEQARQRGLIGKTRIVPEDYGVTDTDGAPPSNPPRIKFSVDSSMNKGVNPLPKELTEAPADRAPIVQALQTAARVDADTDGFMNAVTTHTPPSVPLQAGRPAPAPAPVPVQETALPQPALDEPPVEDAAEGQEAPVPMPRLPAAAQSAPAPAPALRQPTARDRYVCSACGKPFQFRSQLLKHAKETQGHANMVDVIMAPYPLTG